MPATSTLAPALTACARGLGVDPAVDLELDVETLLGDPLGDRLDLLELAGDELLPAEARVDAHHQDQVDLLEHIIERLRRGRRVERHAGLLAERLDRAGSCGGGAGPASGWTVMMSAPASANASRKVSTGEIIRWTSNGFCVCGRSAFTTAGPMVRLGTKWPSITSMWIQSAPASSIARTSSPSLAKSADRIEGAMSGGHGAD